MTNVLIHLQGGSRAVDIHDDSDLWRIEGPSTVLARSGSRGQGDQVPAPILPKSRRESGLPVLESRQSFSRAQVRLHYTHKSSPTFAKCLQTGSLSTVESLVHCRALCDGLWTRIWSFFSCCWCSHGYTDFARCMTPLFCLFVCLFFHICMRTAERQHTRACL